MRSRHADAFNHDDEADGYDLDVTRSEDPVRAGYDEVLDWVAARVLGARRVLELGAGTGNLTLRLPREAHVTCVDVSARMLGVAGEKLPGRDVELVRADLLEYVGDAPDAAFDAVVSTYALHHLEDDEKEAWVDQAVRVLEPGGRLAVGDLAFADGADRERVLREHPGLREADEEEWFWRLDLARPWFERALHDVEARRFSDASWGFAGRRPTSGEATR